MKRITLLLICIATLGLASCQKDTYINQQLLAKTYNYEIKQTDWQRNANGTYTAKWYSNTFDKITLDDEGVLVYFEHPEKETSYIQLPYTYNFSTFSYELFEGGIAFDAQNSTNLTLSAPPDYPVLVKVVVIPSEYVPN